MEEPLKDAMSKLDKSKMIFDPQVHKQWRDAWSLKEEALNGRVIYGGVHPLYDFLFICDFVHEKDFLQVLSKLSQASIVKVFHFSDEWKVVPWNPVHQGSK